MKRGAVRRVARLLRLLADRPGQSVTELSRRAALPYATTHRILATLREERLVRRDDRLRYSADMRPGAGDDQAAGALPPPQLTA